MNAKDIMQTLPKHIDVTKSDTIKRCLCVLIVIALIETLGPTSLSYKGQQKSWLFTSSLSILHSHFLNNLIKEKYVLIDNDKDDFTVKGSKRSHKLSSVGNLEFLTHPIINSHREVFLDVIRSSYISFFASLPLRSPPLFLSIFRFI